MLQRELIRMGVCAAIGLVIGIIEALHSPYWWSFIIFPFFIIGLFYGGRILVKLLGGFGKAAGESVKVLSKVIGGSLIGLIILVIAAIWMVTIILPYVILIGSLIGLILAAKALYDAYSLDSQMGGRNNKPKNNSRPGSGSGESSW